MFHFTFELITQVASNSLFIFCFCNLIIVVILVGSKPSTVNGQESQVRFSSAYRRQETVAKHSAIEGTKMIIDVTQASNAQKAPATAGSNKENADDNDEFRRRVEEFIDKVNRGWKAESMRTSCLV
ncbi:hypothetical protein MANES_06G137900v8 [Manihot esculenta]|uniref:DUF4408 domain-containing protein n=1 Tax=Manihot esculenta TaxID=3983 RepID=A0A2C9VSQ1_MANES|nr:hypothetical protein MANES_06G137900v8 [Manihot esculenta]